MEGDADYTQTTDDKQSASSSSTSPLSGIRCDDWKVTEESLPTSASEAQTRESIFSLGNGVVGVRGFLEESEWNDRTHRSSSEAYSTLSSNNNRTNGQTSCVGEEHCEGAKTRLRGVYVAGFTEQCIQQDVGWLSCGISTKDSLLVPVPDPFGINVFIGGELVSTTTGRVLRHARRLDLRTGELHRLLEWESSQHQRRVRIESTRMLSCVRKNIGAIRYTVWAQKTYNTDIRIASYISLPTDSATARACTVEAMSDSSDMNSSTNVVMTRTRNSCRRVAVATFEKCLWNNEGEALSTASLSFLHQLPNADQNSSEFEESTRYGNDFSGISLLQHRDQLSWTPMVPQTQQTDYGCEVMYSCCDNDNVCVDIVKFAGFFTEDDAPVDELCEHAENQIRSVAAKGYEALYDAHHQKMAHLWETMDVKMKVNPVISAAYRFNALQVLMSSNPFPFYGFPSRGLSSSSTSCSGYHTWEVDAIVIPFLSHVYPQRARNLLEFRCRNLHHARIHAQDIELRRGAWYPYRTVNGNDCETPFYVAYIFLNAVIAYAMRQYVTITNDFSILFKDGGAEAVMASALVYLEWGTWDRGGFHLRAVSGPDTMSGVVDNNFFTNLMVQQHLEWAVQIASVCRKNDPGFWEELMARNEMSEGDVEMMEKAASHLVLVFDARYRVHAMDQYFMKKKQWNPENGLVQDLKGNSLAHPQISRYQLCSIPDVVLACMLLPEKFTSDEVHANFNFYEPITVAWESPIRLGIFSVISAQLRLPDKSNRYFRELLSANLSNSPHNVDGVDCPTAASTWWALAMGFCGMRVIQGVLHFSPTLPHECEGYQFTCRHNGCVIKVKVARRTAQYLLVSAASSVEEVLIVHSLATRLHLKCGVTEVVKLGGDLPTHNFESVVFDIYSLFSNISDILFKAWNKVLKKFFHVEKNKPDFILTKEMFTEYLQDEQPVEGLKRICDLAKCSLEIAQEDQPYISTEIVLYGLCNQKNEAFRKVAEKHGLLFREGAIELLTQLHQADIAVGCVASRPFGRWLLKQFPNLSSLLDSYVDGAVGSELSLSFSSADFFHHCAKKLASPTSRTILVLESAAAFYPNHLDPFCAVVDLQRSEAAGGEERKRQKSPLNQSTMLRLTSVNSLQEINLVLLDRAASRFR